MRNYERCYYHRPIREGYRTRMYEDVDYEGSVPEVLTAEWLEQNFYLDAEQIVIPQGVKELGENCFSDCDALESIKIPNSVTKIGDGCFAYCRELRSIKIPNSVTSLGSSCFEGCESLETVTIPDSVTHIGEYCFIDCMSLKSITIPGSVKDVSDGCFEGCPLAKSITIKPGVRSLGRACFWGCDNVQSITIPTSVVSIGRDCFEKHDTYNNEDIYYGGSKQQRDKVEIGDHNNAILGSGATWHYSDTESFKSRYTHNRPIREGIGYTRPYRRYTRR